MIEEADKKNENKRDGNGNRVVVLFRRLPNSRKRYSKSTTAISGNNVVVETLKLNIPLKSRINHGKNQERRNHQGNCHFGQERKVNCIVTHTHTHTNRWQGLPGPAQTAGGNRWETARSRLVALALAVVISVVIPSRPF